MTQRRRFSAEYKREAVAVRATWTMPHSSRDIKYGCCFLFVLAVVGIYPADKISGNPIQEFNQSKMMQTTNTTGVPPGYSTENVEVKFRVDVPLEPTEDKLVLPPGLRSFVTHMRPLFGLSKDKLDELRERGNRTVTVPPDMSRWYRISLKPGTDVVGFVEELRRLDSVESVQFTPLPAPPPAP